LKLDHGSRFCKFQRRALVPGMGGSFLTEFD